MASVYSKKLADGTIPAGTAAVVYTAPAGLTVIVRCIVLALTGAGAGTAFLERAGGPILFSAATSELYQSFTSNLRYVMNPGDELEMVSIALNWTFAISGYVLD